MPPITALTAHTISLLRRASGDYASFNNGFGAAFETGTDSASGSGSAGGGSSNSGQLLFSPAYAIDAQGMAIDGAPYDSPHGFSDAAGLTVVSSNHAFRGDRTFQFNAPAGNPDVYGVWGGARDIGRYYKGEIVNVQAAFYFPAGFPFIDDTVIKMLRIHQSDAGGGNIGWYSLLTTGYDGYYNDYGGYPPSAISGDYQGLIYNNEGTSYQTMLDAQPLQWAMANDKACKKTVRFNVTFTVANAALYSLSVVVLKRSNTTRYNKTISFTSDSNATAAEIAMGLAAAIAADVNIGNLLATTVVGGKLVVTPLLKSAFFIEPITGNCSVTNDSDAYFQTGIHEVIELRLVLDDVAVDNGGTGRATIFKNVGGTIDANGRRIGGTMRMVGDITSDPTINGVGAYVDRLAMFTYWNGLTPTGLQCYGQSWVEHDQSKLIEYDESGQFKIIGGIY